MTNPNPTTPAEPYKNEGEKPTNAPPLTPPKAIDEATLVRQLAAAEAEGVTVFSERPIQGDRPNRDLGLVRIAQPVYGNGVFRFSLNPDNPEGTPSVFTTEYLAHQVRSILALRGTLEGYKDQVKDRYLVPFDQPSSEEDNEGYNVFAEWADDEKTLVQVQMRREKDVLSFKLFPQDALLWALETARIYEKLTIEQREARLVKVHGIGKAAQVPINRMKAEGAAPYAHDAEFGQ